MTTTQEHNSQHKKTTSGKDKCAIEHANEDTIVSADALRGNKTQELIKGVLG